MISGRVALLVVIAITTSAPSSGARTAASNIAWTRSYSDGLKVAQQTGKPVLLDFNARWCGPCRAMDREVWPERKVIEQAQRFVCVSVDVDNEKWLDQQFLVDELPLLVVVDPFGNQLSRRTGYKGANELTDWLKGFPGDYSEILEALAACEADPNAVLAATNVGNFYAHLGFGPVSRKYYEKALRAPAVQGDVAKREEVLFAMGRAFFRAGDMNAARKAFERCLKDCPNGRRGDVVMLGLQATQLRQGKTEAARRTLAAMKARYPNSAATAQARKNLQDIQTATR